MRKAGTQEEPLQASAVFCKPSKSALDAIEKLSPSIDADSGLGTSPLVAGSTFAQLREAVGEVNA
jgi:hypothetical protein